MCHFPLDNISGNKYEWHNLFIYLCTFLYLYGNITRVYVQNVTYTVMSIYIYQ
jgi:hypothetical protein